MAEAYYSQVPEQLKSLPNWVTWRLETRDEKPTKIPFSLNGRPASSTDKSTWHTFTEVSHCTPLATSGAGFCFNGDGTIGIDLDHCFKSDGSIDEMFSPVMGAFKDTYKEVSPSGSGLHIFVSCKEAPYPTGKRKNFPDGRGIEIYSSGRYFTVSGKKFGESSKIVEYPAETIRSACDAILSIGKETKKQETLETENAICPQVLSDGDIVKIVSRAKNGVAFAKLYDGKHGYPSASEADLALASMLAFYTKDAAQIRRIMYGSGLLREKWGEHPTYLSGTISAAVSSVKAQYTRTPAKKQQRSEKVSENPAERELETQVHFAEEFMESIRHEWKFNIDANKWIHWNGKVWELDETNHIHNICREFLVSKLRNIGNEASEDQLEDVIKVIIKLNTARGISDILTISKPMCTIKERQLDTMKYYLNMQNGTYDLESGILHPHDSENMLSKICNVEYQASATCPAWINHITAALDGDEELIRNTQELLGYSLFSGTKEVFGVFIGSGRNGKSVTVETVQKVLGSYAVSVNPSCLMDNGCNPGSDRMKMIGARIIVAPEPGDTSKGRCSLDAGFIKAATGGDRLSSRRLYCESVEFEITGLVIIITNTLPQIRDQSVAMRERVWCVPFDHYFDPKDRVASIKEILFAEGSGIINWLIEGYKRYNQTKKLIQCATVRRQTQDYLDEEDGYSQFFSEVGLVRRSGLTISGRDLYNAYLEWHRKTPQQNAPRKETAFGRHMSTRFQKKHTRDGAMYVGVGFSGQENINKIN